MDEIIETAKDEIDLKTEAMNEIKNIKTQLVVIIKINYTHIFNL